MIVINTVSDTKFSFNGITYHKNFMPFVTGDKIAIVNVYDACITLTDAPTHFSGYTVNGVTYTNVEILQASLLDVIYTRLSLGTISGTGTVTNVSLSLGSTGSDINGGVASPTTTPIITINIPTASASNRGVLSASDWSVFNGKQNALGFTPYNATNPAGYISVITSGMVTTALGFTPYNATNPNGYTSNLGTVTSVSGTGTVSGLTLSGTVTSSGILTLGGTLSLTSGQVTTALGYTPYNATNPAGYITSAALSGYLPLTGGTLASSGSANTLNINHTSGSGIALNILKNGNGEGLTIVKGSGTGNAASITGGTTLLSELNLTTKLADAHINSATTWNAKIGGGGTTNYLAKFTASGVVGNSAVFESGGNVGIGTTSPQSTDNFTHLDVVGKITTQGGAIWVSNSNKTTRGILYNTDQIVYVGSVTNTPFVLNTNDTERMRITSGGNLLIGTTTDAGFKLDVNGTGRFKDANTPIKLDNLGGQFTQLDFLNNGTQKSAIWWNNTSNTLNLYTGVTALTIASTGAATFSSSVTATGFFVSSDITLKTLTKDKFDASKIDAISYKWKTDLQGKTLVGYPAQEVQKYMPDAVNTDSNGKLSVDYIQVLVQKVAHLENKLKQHGLE